MTAQSSASLPRPDSVVATRAGSEVFRLVRRGTYGADGQKPWEVRWSGGAEPAAKDAGERIQTAGFVHPLGFVGKQYRITIKSKT